MRRTQVAAALGIAGMLMWMPGRAQNGASTTHQQPLPRVGQANSTNWPLHSLDLHSTRYSVLNQITPANVGTLRMEWTFDPKVGIPQVTPLVIDGVMYFNAGSRLFAVNAVTGESVWTFQLDPPFQGGGRGPAYGDGRIYAYGGALLYAVDAKTGTLVESFGNKGLVSVANAALEFKYPGKYRADLVPASLGYSIRTPPAYYSGVVYVGLAVSDSHIPGGLFMAIDGKTGAIKWVFNTVPQGPEDQGWDLAKDTWIGGVRNGGGIWTQPAIDPDLGLIYFNATNPSPSFDGSARKGINLFTNSVIALRLATGTLAWHYQVVHHDIWDWDFATGPLLFDATAGGRTIKGIAALPKTCYVFMWDRETGQPLNPIVESPVPTTTDVPGEQPWPTQPMPYTSRGVPQQPFCRTYPDVSDPELARRVRPTFHPYLVKEFIITSPGNQGGPDYGPPSFSPRTGLLYVTGKNDAFSIRIRPLGDTTRPGPGSRGFFDGIAERAATGMPITSNVAAYDPLTGQLVWSTEVQGLTNSGNLATAGDVVFQGMGSSVASEPSNRGDLYGLDARSGKVLFKYSTPNGIRASPLTYQVNGKQYITVAAENKILTFALP